MSHDAATPAREEAPGTHRTKHGGLAVLALAAVGVVYGDIGTSPLYAIRECFSGAHAVPVTADNVLGVLSLAFWTLILVVTVKYTLYVLNADNRGEGGILALMALVREHLGSRRLRALVISLGLFGASLLYGDGIITPAISVLGAIEGLTVVTPGMERWIVPLAVVILVVLFMFQRHGTSRVGIVFGPVMVLWFITIGVLGAAAVIREPAVLRAVNPIHAVGFFADNGLAAFLLLGVVFLVATGGEALYADLGHFGRRPIRLDWFLIVLPALLLNYFGQGALLLSRPEAADNPFYRLAPAWAVMPLLVLATAAAIIASQAIISAAFSLTRQAVQLGFLPRAEIVHTSPTQIGQIYVPSVNWALMLATVALVIGFRSSGNLASAYGVAVSNDMVITTILAYFVARRVWGWNRWIAGAVTAGFLTIDLSFFAANILKIHTGGWLPLLIAASVFSVMATWERGSRLLVRNVGRLALPLDDFLGGIEQQIQRVPGTAVFVTGHPAGTPTAMLHNVKHNKVLHEHNVFLTVVNEEVPFVPEEDRMSVEDLGRGFYRVIAHYGFMEAPDVPHVVKQATERLPGLELRMPTYVLSRNALFPARQPPIARWRERIFIFLLRNQLPPTKFFRIPHNQVVEIGRLVTL